MMNGILGMVGDMVGGPMGGMIGSMIGGALSSAGGASGGGMGQDSVSSGGGSQAMSLIGDVLPIVAMLAM